MSFESSIGPSHPISEIATSHVCRLKKTRNDQKSVFFNQESEGTVLYILRVKWVNGCIEVEDHKIYQK